MAQDNETVLYSDRRGVRITNSRAIIGDVTYSMANTTLVSMVSVPAKRGGGIYLTILGLIGIGASIAFGVEVGALAGGGVVILGLLLAILPRSSHAVRIGSASGETNVLTSRDGQYVRAILAAMNQAFVKRG